MPSGGKINQLKIITKNTDDHMAQEHGSQYRPIPRRISRYVPGTSPTVPKTRIACESTETANLSAEMAKTADF